MDILKKFSVSQIIWYLLPGAMFIFIVLFHIGMYFPSTLVKIIDKIGITFLLLSSIIIGFVLDGLRVYRLRPGYKKEKKSFYNKLSNEFNYQLDPKYILDYIYKQMVSTGYNTIRFYHSMWIMQGHVSASILLISNIFNVLLLIINPFKTGYFIFGISVEKALFYVLFVICWIISVVIGLRIMYVSIEGQKNCNEMYLSFAKSNKKQIGEALKNGYV